MSEGSLSGFSETACIRCREQKLRCSRELPQCARCVRFSATCEFPEPPDRRLIAARRESRKRQIACDEPVEMTNRQGKRRQPINLVGAPPMYLCQHKEQTRLPGDIALRSIASLDTTTHQTLQEIYFSSVYNSSLVFHRRTFERESASGDVPEYLYQAMYAMAACFLPSTSLDQNRSARVLSLGDLKTLRVSWAVQAGKAALQNIDQPQLSEVRTCLILALFWFSQGDSKRNTMLSGIAFRAIRCMLQDSAAETAADLEENTLRWLEFEQLRRCFWAAWQMNCTNADHYATGSPTGPQIMSLSLPAEEIAFLEGRDEGSRTLGTKTTEFTQRAPSIMAELMKMVLLWARVRDYLDTRKTSPEDEAWNSSFVLYDELTTWKRQLHPSLNYSKRNLYELLVVQELPVYVLLYSLYHQCCLVLQASLIPALSGSLPQHKTPSEAIRVSAQIALKHAEALSELAADLLALDWDPTRIAPFVGYAMYASGAFLFTVMVRDPIKHDSARDRLVACLRLLKSMKPNWALLEQLWERFQRLYEVQISKGMPSQSEDNPHSLQSNEPRGLIDDDADARSVKDVVNDSVLYFSLRRLQNSAVRMNGVKFNPHRTPLDEILRGSSREQMESILEPSYARVSPQGGRESYTTDSTPLQTKSQDQEAPVTDLSAPDVLLDSSLGNWWEWDLGGDFQAQLTFADYLGMDLNF